jgi:hypothetical protein
MPAMPVSGCLSAVGTGFICWLSAVSSTVLVSCLSSPSGPVSDRPRSQAGAPAPRPPAAQPSLRLVLLACCYSIQCRGRHGTFPAGPSRPAGSGPKRPLDPQSRTR